MLKKKKEELLSSEQKYRQGLQKLQQTSEDVEKIKIEVENKQKEAEIQRVKEYFDDHLKIVWRRWKFEKLGI